MISFVLCYHGNQLDFNSKNISGSFPLTRGRSWVDFKLLLELVQILWLLYCFSKFTINSLLMKVALKSTGNENGFIYNATYNVTKGIKKRIFLFVEIKIFISNAL